MTSRAIRFVLVEGADGDGATVDSGALDIGAAGGSATKSLVEAVLGQGPYAAVPGVRPIAVGVTWSPAAAAQAATLLQAMTDKGVNNVVALSPAEGAAALATGVSDLARQDEIAVCVVEPDLALVAVVTADSVIIDPITGTDPGTVAQGVRRTLESTGARPEAVYALGSADHLPLVVSALGHPGVISAAEADLALARGAALASARGFAGVDARLALAAGVETPQRSRLTWRVPALTSVLAAAVVTFVVSLSVALGMQLTSERSESAQTEQLAASGQLAEAPPAAVTPKAPEAAPRPAAPPPPPPAAPPPPPEVVPAPEPEVAPVSEPVAEAPAPPPVYAEPPAPVYVPPAPEYVAPAPAYVPPAPAPASVPPAPGAPGVVPPQAGYVPPVAPQPRLRDRLIERLPIINRFHEPQYTTP
ncbi:hypothetical protein [Mycolicibacterium sp. S2-37]|uniref:DUF7159 family protein n=1 Tax=Mycolicibacterium sp. S2-37 TaxID=2810297 RepID=UPI0027D9EC78|nr:hypothetical protein [Mycolicibacterium sp. S2-37]